MDVEQKAVDAEGDDAERSRLTQALVKVHNCRHVFCGAVWSTLSIGP